MGSKSIINKIFTAYKNKEKQQELISVRNYNAAILQDSNVPFLEVDGENKPKPTIYNFKSIMLKKEFYANVRFNILANYPERHIKTMRGGEEHLEIRRWSDADEAQSKEYIEQEFASHPIPRAGVQSCP